MKERILQLDYLKGIFIMLMVFFHVQIIEDTYPTLHTAVYTFHMSAFLIISGYLANVEKDFPTFVKGMLRLAVPYVVFEVLYVALIFFLGRAMHSHVEIDELSPWFLCDKVLQNPFGPYWYIHTLIICTIVYYAVYRVLKLKDMSGLALMGAILFGLSLVIEHLKMRNVIYFLIGVFIVRSGNKFTTLIAPSALAAVPLCILFLYPDNFSRVAFWRRNHCACHQFLAFCL